MFLSACWFIRLLMNTMWVGTSPLKDHQGKFLFGSMEAINSKCFCPWSVVLSLFGFRLYMTFLCIFLQLVCGPSQMSFWFWNSMFWMDSRFSLNSFYVFQCPFPGFWYYALCLIILIEFFYCQILEQNNGSYREIFLKALEQVTILWRFSAPLM